MASDDADRLRDFERAAHTRMAPGYDAFFSPVTALATAALLDAVGAGPGTRVLDVACGPGRVAAAAAARGAVAAGVDLAPGMVSLARRLHPGIEFRDAEVESLPLGDGAFDALVCGFGLGHFPRPEAAAAECRRVVRPGGALAFSCWDDPARQRLQALFREAAAEVGAPPPPGVRSIPPCASATRRSSAACSKARGSPKWRCAATRRSAACGTRRRCGRAGWAAPP